jgi:hypothetical protein
MEEVLRKDKEAENNWRGHADNAKSTIGVDLHFHRDWKTILMC